MFELVAQPKDKSAELAKIWVVLTRATERTVSAQLPRWQSLYPGLEFQVRPRTPAVYSPALANGLVALHGGGSR